MSKGDYLVNKGTLYGIVKSILDQNDEDTAQELLWGLFSLLKQYIPQYIEPPANPLVTPSITWQPDKGTTTPNLPYWEYQFTCKAQNESTK